MIRNSNSMVNAEADLASILSIFDPTYIFDIIDVVLSNDYYTSNDTTNITNAIYVVEQKYINKCAECSDDYDILESLKLNRYNLYIEVIEYICNKFDIAVNLDMIDYNNVYYIAYYIYNLLVNYYSNISNFLVAYILKNKNQIYDMYNLAEFKKNKDSSTIYNKKMYKNTKVAIIISNLEYVIQNVVSNVSFDEYVNTIYAEANGVPTVLLNILRPTNPYYVKSMIDSIFKNVNTTLILISDIRVKLSDNIINETLNDISIHDYIETEEENI